MDTTFAIGLVSALTALVASIVGPLVTLTVSKRQFAGRHVAKSERHVIAARTVVDAVMALWHKASVLGYKLTHFQLKGSLAFASKGIVGGGPIHPPKRGGN